MPLLSVGAMAQTGQALPQRPHSHLPLGFSDIDSHEQDLGTTPPPLVPLHGTGPQSSELDSLPLHSQAPAAASAPALASASAGSLPLQQPPAAAATPQPPARHGLFSRSHQHHASVVASAAPAIPLPAISPLSPLSPTTMPAPSGMPLDAMASKPAPAAPPSAAQPAASPAPPLTPTRSRPKGSFRIGIPMSRRKGSTGSADGEGLQPKDSVDEQRSPLSRSLPASSFFHQHYSKMQQTQQQQQRQQQQQQQQQQYQQQQLLHPHLARDGPEPQSPSRTSMSLSLAGSGRKSFSYAITRRSNSDMHFADDHRSGTSSGQPSLHKQTSATLSIGSTSHGSLLRRTTLSSPTAQTAPRGFSSISLATAAATLTPSASGTGTPNRAGSRRTSNPLLAEPVRETFQMVRDYDPQTGNKMINNYMVIREIGRGVHGKVKLCIDTETNEKWAIKIVEKNAKRRFQSKLSAAARAAAEGGQEPPNPQLEKIKREIAILKKCAHPHVVRLHEVIDDPHSDKIYLVLEYLEGGEITWHDSSDPPRPVLSIDETRAIFRDVVCGVQYLHYQGIVHRDIKPANLLWTADHRVKISDFGVSVFVGRRRKRRPRVHMGGGAATAGSGTDTRNDISRLRDRHRRDRSRASFSRPHSRDDPADRIASGVLSDSALLDDMGETTNDDEEAAPRASMDGLPEETDELELAKTAGSPAFFAPELCGMGDEELMASISSISARVQQIQASRAHALGGFPAAAPVPIAGQGVPSLDELDESLDLSRSFATEAPLSVSSAAPSPLPAPLPSPALQPRMSGTMLPSPTDGRSVASSSHDRLRGFVHLPVKHASGASLSAASGSSAHPTSQADQDTGPADAAHTHLHASHPPHPPHPPQQQQQQLQLPRPSSSSLRLAASTRSASLVSANAAALAAAVSASGAHSGSQATTPTTPTTPLSAAADHRLSMQLEGVREDAVGERAPGGSPVRVVAPAHSMHSMHSLHSMHSAQSLARKDPARPIHGPTSRPSFSSSIRRSGSFAASIAAASGGAAPRVVIVDAQNGSDTGAGSDAPPIGAPIDIWAMGVTLFCFVFGRVPFIADTEFELFNVIIKQPVVFPEEPPIDDNLRDLFLRLLEKEPTKRATLEEIKSHPWLTADMTPAERVAWFEQTDPSFQYAERLFASEEDVSKALTVMDRIRNRIRKISNSFHNLAAGLSFRRRTLSMPSVGPDGTSPAASPTSRNASHADLNPSQPAAAVVPGSPQQYQQPLQHPESRISTSSRRSIRSSVTSPVPPVPPLPAGAAQQRVRPSLEGVGAPSPSAPIAIAASARSVPTPAAAGSEEPRQLATSPAWVRWGDGEHAETPLARLTLDRSRPWDEDAVPVRSSLSLSRSMSAHTSAVPGFSPAGASLPRTSFAAAAAAAAATAAGAATAAAASVPDPFAYIPHEAFASYGGPEDLGGEVIPSPPRDTLDRIQIVRRESSNSVTAGPDATAPMPLAPPRASFQFASSPEPYESPSAGEEYDRFDDLHKQSHAHRRSVTPRNARPLGSRVLASQHDDSATPTPSKRRDSTRLAGMPASGRSHEDDDDDDEEDEAQAARDLAAIQAERERVLAWSQAYDAGDEGDNDDEVAVPVAKSSRFR
nr:hypothetical protein HK105_005814 [Polyrhizophydium stewartii]